MFASRMLEPLAAPDNVAKHWSTSLKTTPGPKTKSTVASSYSYWEA